MTKSKGVEDFIKVVNEIKNTKTRCTRLYYWIGGDIKPFITLSEGFGCKNNIEFIGFVKSQKDLFEYVKSSRVFLAPPYNERLSSTIREAMLLKVPIVAYATGGIPYINEFDENIYLVKTGDYKEMAAKTLLLLQDDKCAEQLALKAYNYCIKEFSLNINTARLINAYYTIINETRGQYGLQNPSF